MNGPSERATGAAAVRVDLEVTEFAVVPEQPVELELEVTNLDAVIRSYRVTVLGLDQSWVEVDRPVLDLFPDERQRVTITLTLPSTFPAGRHHVGIEVTEPHALPGIEHLGPPGAPHVPPGVLGGHGAPILLGGGPAALTAMTAVELTVPATDGLQLSVLPESLTVGRQGTYVLDVANTGNTTLMPTLVLDDPERLTDVVFDPPAPTILPGERVVVDATVRSTRPWFGMPAVRVLEFSTAAEQARAARAAVLIVRPRVSRRALAFFGLLLVVTIFAFVIAQAFGSVAERTDASEQMLRRGLGEDGPGVRVAPANLSGSVMSTTGGPISGAVVELFDPASPVLAQHSTVTGEQGGFQFGSVSPGSYLVRVEVAGFDEVWWPSADSIADAEVLELDEGALIDDLLIELAGRPGSISGRVAGEEVAGALVAAQLAPDALDGSDLEDTPAVIASVALDATGEFVLDELPTPATYELTVQLVGFATETFAITLGPGEQRSGIEVLLRAGDGRIAGQVVDTAGEPVGNAEIVATDGTTTLRTRSLSSGDDLGSFELRDLVTPMTYTLEISAEGFGRESITFALEQEEVLDDVTIVLTSGVGSLAGRVSGPDGSPLGGIDVTVVGGEIEQRRAVSLSVGDPGRWLATDLPAPGAYTVTFSAEGYVTQAVSVEIGVGADANRDDINVRLSVLNASVRGRVTEPSGAPIGGVSITLDGASIERNTISGDDPPGAYGFADLPPGAYTITFSRVGSRSQTLLVDLVAGQNLVLPDVQLEPQATIRGIVVRGGVGEPGVGVDVFTLEGYPLTPSASTVTGPGGTFEIIGLDAPDTYVVEFRVPAGGAVVGSVTTFLQSGETVDVEFELVTDQDRLLEGL